MAAAVANTAARSPDNVKLDEGRKPAEVLEFLASAAACRCSICSAPTLLGRDHGAPSGRRATSVWQPAQFYDTEAQDTFAGVRGQAPERRADLTPVRGARRCRSNYFDFVILNLDYHDIYWQSAKYGIPRMDPTRASRRSTRR